ncbi:hypothetical protein N7522_006837 [Penicillium canescens]|uniref:Uncharacterized protein n=1 Tax=Penicillium canescens TaxID=5083 RepID=A0AAD6N6H3_PENCN|nr:uncharacterized protein N7446_010090 [Penicillium canescens]KAJ6001610.1 hypothetical protein N7522_006837 [Penicillium canescens]KAJ6035331.1 hypothetical protein N7460_009506 [Penicillium canescens]KAJ6037459.1 hypothetical protein N7444_010164 [Penicillium canescens]KAJ6054078.1 hypothetical protein N7446_010090 [Penicillium canescens]
MLDENSVASPEEGASVDRRKNPPRRSKRPGRPRLDAPGASVLSQERRDQLRQAQKVHRLKQKAIFQNATVRVSELEDQIGKIRDAFANLENDASVSHPAIYQRLNKLRAAIFQPQSESPEKSPAASEKANHSPPPDIFEYVASRRLLLQPDSTNRLGEGVSFSTSSSFNLDDDHSAIQSRSWVERPLSDSEHLSYYFQETSFTRGLHRYCLEHAFRLFIDPRSSPTANYRIFRLVSCIRDREKTYPYFKRLVTGGIEDKLELPGLPFYCIGGAGTHYPPKDEFGNAIYPPNRRMPKRILGSMAIAERSLDGDTGFNQLKVLETFGLGGQWFDCRDVEGYLSERGVSLKQYCALPKVPDRKADRILDIDLFCRKLLHSTVILGRVPGFRKTDVEHAFTSSLRRDISSS